jgi:proline iminopeptidase
MRAIEYDCKEALRSFEKPTLIIQGMQDIIDKETAIRTQEVLPHSKVILLEKCSHYGWLDQKEEYFGTIEAFLKAKQIEY